MEVHRLRWTDEHVRRFWDYWSRRETDERHYFASQVGDGICKLIQFATPLRNQLVLDFGAGAGHLTQRMMASNAYVHAVEFSHKSLEKLDTRFAADRFWSGSTCFDGGQLPLKENQFDIVCCLETVEHLTDQHCDKVLDELLRVLKPGGTCLITTPNSEQLNHNQVFCPNCCHEFHRWQHVRRWTPDSLREALRARGFDVTFCRGLNLHDFNSRRLRPLSTAFWRRTIRSLLASCWDFVWPRRFPWQRSLQQKMGVKAGHHLVAFATKPVSGEALDTRHAFAA